VPSFQVKVGQRLLKAEVIRDILQVTYKDSLKDVDSFEISINNWDADKRTFKYSDKDVFNPGKLVELKMGYLNEEIQLMLTGQITSLRPTFPSGGQPTLAVSGLNLLHSLRRRQRSRPYRGMTDNDIARDVARRLGVEIEVKNGYAGSRIEHKYIFQHNQYDILFLMQRARRIGYDLYVKETGARGGAQGGTLYFGPSTGERRTTYELEYGKTLIEFQPNLTTAKQVNRVEVHAWDRVHKRPITGEAERENLETRGLPNARDQQQIARAFAEREEIIADRPVDNRDEANQMAQETLERIAKDMVKGSGSVIGLPGLRAGTVLHLEGLGERFSGRYFVTSTTHTIGGSGYTTRFECRLEEL
jgi:phage protein D